MDVNKLTDYKFGVFDSDLLPDVVFHMRERDDTIDDPNPFKWVRKTTSELFAGKTVLIFGLPGAFTPTCSNSQLPGYEELYDEFIAAGIDEVYCTSVNDAFVMHCWKQHQGVKKVQMLPDGNGEFAKGLGMLIDKSNIGFGNRSWRYAMVVKDLEIQQVFEEQGYPRDLHPTDPYGVSSPIHVLSTLQGEEALPNT